MQALASEAADYSKQSFEAGTAAFEKLLAAGSVDKAVEVEQDEGKLEQAPCRRLLLVPRLPINRGATLTVRTLHHAVHDTEGFATHAVGIESRQAGFDALTRDLDILQALVCYLAASNAIVE